MSRSDDLKKLITKHTRRLQLLKEKQATFGLNTPPEILTEIEDIAAELDQLSTELDRLVQAPRFNPYRGLSAFREEDANIFFGRESFTTQLVDSVQQKPLVAVLGPSGSGKSSIVFAGLLPTLRREGRWLIATFRPGQEPGRALAAALLPLLAPSLSEVDQLVERRKMSEALSQGKLDLSEVVARIVEKSAPVERLLLVVDQFEELYTLCPEPLIRHSFLDTLLPVVVLAPSTPRPPTLLHLVLTLRADFLTQALTYRPFADALREADVKLGPMTLEELRRAIEQPAETQGVIFEPGLVDRILADVSDEPGNLPLLEFALTALWEQQSRGELTHAAYDTIGRVDGALSRHAEQVFAGLSEVEQTQARRVFVQMVRPGEGTEDTRRLAHRDELNEADWALVQQLASARLVVTDQDPVEQETVEVVHEALIRGWNRLNSWMNEDRRFRAWQERLRAARRQWEASQQDEGALLRGAPLAEAEAWLAERESQLNRVERAFIQAGVSLREREAAEREAQRQRELETAQKLAKEQRQRAIWLGIAGVVALLLAAVAVIFGVQANQAAQEIALKNDAAEAELNFSQTIADPQVRVNYLVQLFDRPGYKSLAMKLFWKLPQEDQLALFKIKDDRLVGVIKELYITPADVNRTGYTDPLLAAMVEALANDFKETTPLKAELDQWRQARTMAGQGQYEAAQAEYDKLIDLNGDNPATHYERAGVLAELSDDQAALADLDRVMALVIGNPSLASTGLNEGSSEFATVDQATWAVRRLIEVKPELGRVLNSSDAAYSHLQYRDLVLATTSMTDARGSAMVLVPAGPFEMGSNSGNPDERPTHSVTLATFYIDQYEVTNAQFAVFLKDRGNHEEGGVTWLSEDSARIHQTGKEWQPDEGYANHPVGGVTWYGAKAYCQWRQARLPTEAEWEKAARGTDGHTYPWGQVITCKVANYWAGENGCEVGTTPVGAYPTGVSPYRAFDMAGNVYEWVADWYDEKYYSNSPPEDPFGPQKGAFKVLRGGSWGDVDRDVRAPYRYSSIPVIQDKYIGFRCAVSAP